MLSSPVATKSITVLYANAENEPIATSVSIFGDSLITPLNPLMKNFWLMTITIAARSISRSPTAIGLLSKNAGIGNPSIL